MDENTNGTRWDALSHAFRAYGYPTENLALVQRIMDNVGIHHYEEISSHSYIKAIRKDGGRTLTIYFGYTSGFDSEEAVVDVAGDVWRERSDKGGGWYVVHPLNDIGDHHRGGQGPLGTRSTLKLCETCRMELPMSGICDSCGS